MGIRNNALIISSNNTFSSKYQKLFKRNNFNVSNFNDLNQWIEPKFVDDAKIDICLIDNENGAFNFDEFFEKLNVSNSKSLVVNVGKKKKIFHNNHRPLFYLNPESKSIDLEIFFKNVNQLLERDKAQTELAANLLHDLRSPLTSLITYVELLLNETFGNLNAGQKNFLEKAMIIGDQVFDMLEEINEVFKNDQYTFLLKKEDFSLSQLIDEMLLKIWIQADAKNIQIKKDISKNLPAIYGDPFQIQRVFINLLGNSIKYCPDNSKITIKIKSPPKIAKSIEIEIMDNGGGIPETKLRKIFNKHYRMEQIQKIKEGQGLGLYISKLVIKAHKGKIWATNNKNGGLSFSFTLPISK
jgi:signal transduction histidine kinase